MMCNSCWWLKTSVQGIWIHKWVLHTKKCSFYADKVYTKIQSEVKQTIHWQHHPKSSGIEQTTSPPRLHPIGAGSNTTHLSATSFDILSAFIHLSLVGLYVILPLIMYRNHYISKCDKSVNATVAKLYAVLTGNWQEESILQTVNRWLGHFSPNYGKANSGFSTHSYIRERWRRYSSQWQWAKGCFRIHTIWTTAGW